MRPLAVPKRLQGSKGYRRSPNQEKELAKRFTGHRTQASGSRDEKGDVRKIGVMRVEAKTTQAKSFRITSEMLDKIEDASLPAGEVPAVIVEFIDDNGKPIREVAVVPSYVLDMVIQEPQ